MNILVVLIPVSMLLLIGAGVALFWAVDHGQFDDMDTPGILPLLDSDTTIADAKGAVAAGGAVETDRPALARADHR